MFRSFPCLCAKRELRAMQLAVILVVTWPRVVVQSLQHYSPSSTDPIVLRSPAHRFDFWMIRARTWTHFGSRLDAATSGIVRTSRATLGLVRSRTWRRRNISLVLWPFLFAKRPFRWAWACFVERSFRVVPEDVWNWLKERHFAVTW